MPPAVTWAFAKPSVPRTGRTKRLGAGRGAGELRGRELMERLRGLYPGIFDHHTAEAVVQRARKDLRCGQLRRRGAARLKVRYNGAQRVLPQQVYLQLRRLAGHCRRRARKVEGRGAGNARLREKQLARRTVERPTLRAERYPAVGLYPLQRAGILRRGSYLHQRGAQGRPRVAEGLQKLISVPASAQFLPGEAAAGHYNGVRFMPRAALRDHGEAAAGKAAYLPRAVAGQQLRPGGLEREAEHVHHTVRAVRQGIYPPAALLHGEQAD